MNPWLTPGWELLSQNLSQDKNLLEQWLPPQIEFDITGKRRAEAKVIDEVTGYSKQLGTLSEAMLELARGNPTEALADLKALSEQIDAAKKKHAAQLTRDIRSSLDQLALIDPDALTELLDQYR